MEPTAHQHNVFRPPQARSESELSYAQKHLSLRTTTIQTHRHVDVDAAFSVALWAHLIGKSLVDCELRFSGATLNGDEGFVGIDVHGGLKGRQNSAFEALTVLLSDVERKSLEGLTRYVSAEDQARFCFSDSALLEGSLATIIEHKHLAGEDDRSICLWAENVLLVRLKAGEKIARCEALAERATSFAQGKVRLVDSDEYLVQQILFRQGADFVVYDAGNNVGVKRSPNRDSPHLGELLRGVSGTENFYVEPNGFIFCSGSQKAPAKARPPVSGFDLARLLESRLYSH